MKSEVYQYINKKELFKIMGLSSIQQILIALSTYSLIKAGLSYEKPPVLLAWGLASFGFHLLAPAMQILVKKWECDLHFESYYGFLKKNLLQKYGVTMLWRRKEIKESFMASLGVDAEGYLGAVLFIGLDVFSFMVSLLLGVLILGGTLDIAFLPAFFVSGVLSFLFYRALSPRVKKIYEEEQEARTSFNGHILNSWDSIFIKNRSIMSRYKGLLQQKFNRAKEVSKEADSRAEALVFILGLVSAFPVVVCVAWLGFENIANHQIGALLALLATIPRQLNMLTTFRSIFQNMTAFLGYNSKFKVLHEGVHLESGFKHEQIQLDKIIVNSKQYATLSEVAETVQNLPPGRYEVRGTNGSGKSTLLLHLNEQLSGSFYLPSSPRLAIDDKEVSGSSGEQMLRHIHYLKNESEQILLLDEWDANLDRNNLLKTEDSLNELAQSKVILEVRHR